MDKVVDLISYRLQQEAKEPHCTTETICLKCGDRTLSSFNSKYWLSELYCSKCNDKGYLICTGQILPDMNTTATGPYAKKYTDNVVTFGGENNE